MQTYSKADKASLWFVAWMWSFSLWPYVLSVVRRIPVLQFFTGYIIQIISIVLALLAISNNKNRLKPSDVIFCIVVVFVYLFHMAVFPDNLGKLQEISSFFFFTCLPYFIVGLFVDFNKQKPVLEYVSIAVILFNLLYRYVFRVSEGDNLFDDSLTEDMVTAYLFLPHLLLLLYSILQKFNIWKLFCVLVAFLVICGSGNRGSLLMLIFFLVLYFTLIKQYKTPVFSRVVVIALGIVGFSFLPVFAQFMSKQLIGLSMGFSDRAFRYYLEGNMAFDNGRDAISKILYSKLNESPLWGYGLCGDRVLTGLWAHNFLLELWVSFGYLFGSLIFGVLVVFIIQAYKKCNIVDEKGFLLVLFLMGFAVMFISNTFLQNRFFWLLLGYVVCLRRNVPSLANT